MGKLPLEGNRIQVDRGAHRCAGGLFVSVVEGRTDEAGWTGIWAEKEGAYNIGISASSEASPGAVIGRERDRLQVPREGGPWMCE